MPRAASLTVIACLVLLAVAIPAASAADSREIVLWPEGVPEPKLAAEPTESVEKGKDGISRRSHVSNPRLVVYDIPRADAATLRSAVVVIPGGGFNILADEHEGTDVCRWLNERGMVAFLLLHRVPTAKLEPANAGPVLDAQKAVHEVRSRAAQFAIDPRRIALLGFSAGGQTALVAATNPARFPTAVVLVYPWRVGGDGGMGVRADVTIDGSTPPMFIAQAANDPASLPQSAAALYLALLEAKVPAEIHIYENGGHGFGMRPRDNAPGTSDWPNRALDWLHARGM
jgi:acetyl esterase/lipase